MLTRTEAAAWISKKAMWTTPADPADPTVIRIAVGYAGAEIMASGDRSWKTDLATLQEYAELFGMNNSDVTAAIDKAAATLMS